MEGTSSRAPCSKLPIQEMQPTTHADANTHSSPEEESMSSSYCAFEGEEDHLDRSPTAVVLHWSMVLADGSEYSPPSQSAAMQ